MLVSLKEIIDIAEKGNFAIPAFNVYNTETVMGVIKAAEELRAPVILQVYPRLLNEEVGYYLAPCIVAAARKATVPVCFHLDHGPSELEVQKALRWGATGIMYDGSVHEFEENIANTKHIIDVCGAVDITVEGSKAEINAIPQLIAGIIFNLCDNAIKYNKSGGTVNIIVENNHSNIKLTVKDTGIGIPYEDFSRIFERFYRVDKSHSKEVGGTGLGLSIVKHAALIHNAQIELKSAINEGTEISVVFPK